MSGQFDLGSGEFDSTKYQKRALKEGYFHRVLVAFDQFVNVIFGGLPDETISARAERADARGNWLGGFITICLHLFQRQHGQRAESGDLARAEQIEEIEEKDLGVKEP